MNGHQEQRDLRQWLINAVDTELATVQAAVLIICEGCQGVLLGRLSVAIDSDPTRERAWINWADAVELASCFSGGERRLIAIAASVASGHPVDLSDALTGLDNRNAELVAKALTYALGVDPTTGGHP